MSALEFGDYLSISFANDDDISGSSTKEELQDMQTKRILPFANSSLYHAAVTKVKRLTKGEDVKAVYNLALDIQDINHEFEPGDTIGILPCNDENEVEQILIRLNLISVATKVYKLSILKETTKKKASIPMHIPDSGTLHELFMKQLDIRSLPKKLFLRSLMRYTTQPEEVEKLQLLCSPKVSPEYNKFIINNRSLLSLLTAFPSCHPPIERVLENLPQLQPRPYSVSSSPLLKTVQKELHITFAIINTDWNAKGVCSGWLENTIKKSKSEEENVDSASATENVLIDSKSRRDVPFYFRKINHFRLPKDSSIPIIMIGPGTGVAPFIGFLQHRQLQTEKDDVKFGTSWLFYGCRYSDRDFLYKCEIERFLENGTLTKLFTCFSRENSKKTYVQDVIRSNGKDFIHQVIHENASIYICGDAKNMAKDVRRTIVSCLEDVEGFSAVHAETFVKHLEQTNRYIQDVWI